MSRCPKVACTVPKAAAKSCMQEGGRGIFDKISEVFVLAQPPSDVIIIMPLLHFFGPEDDDNTHTNSLFGKDFQASSGVALVALRAPINVESFQTGLVNRCGQVWK